MVPSQNWLRLLGNILYYIAKSRFLFASAAPEKPDLKRVMPNKVLFFFELNKVSFWFGLSPIYNLQLLPKSIFQPRTPKLGNFIPPTLETVQFSTLD
jgi:hypothetical protein